MLSDTGEPRSRLGSVIHGVGRHPVARALNRLPPVRSAVTALLISTTVRERLRFVLAELLPVARGSARRYHLAGSGRVVLIRHGTTDARTLTEVFLDRVYRLPAGWAVDVASRSGSPRVLDLGGNIGLFTLYALDELPTASVTVFEPDPANAALIRQVVAANRLGDRIELVEACAGTVDGSVSFLAGRHSASRTADPGEPGAITLPQRDAAARLVAVDLLKLDIEGGEWELLADERFGATPPGLVLMEYHAHRCPGPSPRAEAERLLEAVGYRTEVLVEHPTRDLDSADAVGMLLARRPPVDTRPPLS